MTIRDLLTAARGYVAAAISVGLDNVNARNLTKRGNSLSNATVPNENEIVLFVRDVTQKLFPIRNLVRQNDYAKRYPSSDISAFWNAANNHDASVEAAERAGLFQRNMQRSTPRQQIRRDVARLESRSAPPGYDQSNITINSPNNNMILIFAGVAILLLLMRK